MSKADQWSGSVWFIFSLFACYLSYKLGLGTVHQPGPGFVFFWTAIVVAVLSLVVVVKSFAEEPTEEKKVYFTTSGVRKTVLVLLALFLYGLLLEWAGFIVMTLLLLIFLLRAIEKKTWLFTLLMSLTATALSYLLFETALQSQLPKGLLEYLRF
jgi:putative tricarboxylic transport membrane protein